MGREIIEKAKSLAKEIRIAELEMFGNLGFGHVGGSLSITDVIAVLYSGVMKYDPKNPKWDERDRIVMSKGHAGPALYATLAIKGFFEREMLMTLNQGGTNLPSHCDKTKTPGIDMTTGSLGQGISSAAGIAVACKAKGNKVYCVIGDGETQEGQVWEAFLFAGQKKLDNFVVILDRNKKQIDDDVENICDLGDMAAKLALFGWNSFEIEDGNNIEQIYDALEKANSFNNGKPTFIVANTIKGYGVPFIQNAGSNHHMALKNEDCLNAVKELKEGK